MMRVYSSILMSSLLLSAGAVNAQSLETRSTFFARDNSAPEILTAVADTQTFYDKEPDNNTPPGRGQGR
ncbi:MULTISPECIES: heterocyst-inhibiting protein PatX [unclassified Microcoleus]|uniref:heterocyst-inhibiting protein PatX n=1 Tax=unclassified Microcoleus TaxID=2642155 RepID=UPI002FD0F06F